MTLHVQPVSIVDAVSQDLREKLFSGMLTSDVQLTEAEVATSYGVARPTAKAAIEKLVAEGLLLRGAHKTARVPSMGIDDVRDLYFSRSLIEVEVIRRLAERRMVPPGMTTAHEAVLAVGDRAGGGVIDPVVQFHLVLVGSLGSARVLRVFSTLMGEMRLCMAQMQSRRLLNPQVIADEHASIIAQIAAGNPEGAARAMFDHLRRAEDRLVPALENAAGTESATH